jgi:hypothetical protein
MYWQDLSSEQREQVVSYILNRSNEHQKDLRELKTGTEKQEYIDHWMNCNNNTDTVIRYLRFAYT